VHQWIRNHSSLNCLETLATGRLRPQNGPKATRREEANVLPRKSACSRLWCYGMWLGIQFALSFPGQSQFYGLQGALSRDFFSSHKNSTFFDKEYENFYFSRGGNPTRSRAGVRRAGRVRSCHLLCFIVHFSVYSSEIYCSNSLIKV